MAETRILTNSHEAEKGAAMKRKDRKEQIEQALRQGEKLMGTEEASRAWQRLCRELRAMSEPEARMPRFDRLLRAVWVAATNEQS